MAPTHSAPRSYAERLSAPASLWVAVAAFAVVLGVSFAAALGPVAGAVAFAGPALAGSLLLRRTAAEVRVEDSVLWAGPAHIPVSALGPARALTPAQAREVRGPGSDPAAYHLIRGWVPAGVLAEVRDPQDPTPYWFVASRRPEELAAAIEAARSATAG